MSRSIQLGMLVACLCLVTWPESDATGDMEFVYGGYNVYRQINIERYKACGFNSIAILLKTDQDDSLYGINSLADESLFVFAAMNNTDTSDGEEYAHVWEAAEEAQLIHWEAEKELFDSSWLTEVIHVKGDTDDSVWYVDTTDTAGVAWELRSYNQRQGVAYTALFYLAIDTIPDSGVAIAELKLFEHGDTTPTSRLVMSESFNAPDSFHAIPLTYHKIGPTTSRWRTKMQVVWNGEYRLAMDSLVIYTEDGARLMRDSLSEIRDSVLTQVARYDSAVIPGTSRPALRWWAGVEDMDAGDSVTELILFDRYEPAKYLDSLIRKNSGDSNSVGQGFLWDRSGTYPYAYRPFDSFFVSLNPREYLFFAYPFKDSRPMPSRFDVDSLNILLDNLSLSLKLKRELTERAGVAMYYVAGAYTFQGSGLADRSRPTSAEMMCVSFIGFCYGIDGLWYWPYDESLGLKNSGLVTGGSQDTTHKYNAVKDCVSPIVRRYADTLMALDWRGGGLAVDVCQSSESFIDTAIQHNLSDSYVEVGLYEDAQQSADYAVLVNRNTSPLSARQMTIRINAGDLLNPSATHYYVIDMNPDYVGPTQDTLLAGPVGGKINYYTEIEPGGIRIIKVVPAADHIAGSAFPEKWWGDIHAGTGLTVASGRHLQMAPGTHLTMHSDGWGDGLMVQGQLTAKGSADSLIGFDFSFDGVPCDTEIVNCDGFDSTHWDGITLQASAPCSLSYCVISNASHPCYNNIGRDVVLQDVTTTGSGPVAYEQTGGLVSMNAANCSFDGAVFILAGSAWIQGCTIDSSTLGVYAANPGQSTDTVTMIGCHLSHIDSIAIMADEVPLIVKSCSVTVAGYGIRAANTPVWIDSSTIEDALEGIRLDSAGGASGASENRLIDCQIGLIAQKGYGTFNGLTISGSDTAAVLNPGDGQVLAISKGRISDCGKGITARSGTLGLDSCSIIADSLSAIDASTGSVRLWLDTCLLQASADNGAALAAGPDAHVAWANRCLVQNSYIGFELKSEAPDTIVNCTFTNNTLYSLWFDQGDTVDYSFKNLVQNDTATATNMGIFVNRQSILSDSDVVRGGFNWNYNFYPAIETGLSARIIDLQLTGKRGDSWGLVLNGPYTTNADSAFVRRAVIDSFFLGAHIYIRWIYTEIEDGHIVTSTDSTEASDIGVFERSFTSGHVACTKIHNQRVACVKRESATSNMCWTEYGSPTLMEGDNNIYTTTELGSVFFWNQGGDTVDIEHNWWGSDPPDSTRFTGKIDYDPWESDSSCGLEEPPEAKVAITEMGLPAEFALDQNHPNPFNPVTAISFALPVNQSVSIEIYNILGRRVRLFDLGVLPAGYGTVKWDGTLQTGQPVGSGIYLYRITTPEFTDTKKMLLLK